MVTAAEMLVHCVHAFAIPVISGAMHLHRVKTPMSVLLAPMSVCHQLNAWTHLGLTVANVLPLLDGPLMAEHVLILMSVNTQTCATHRLHATTTLEDLNAVVIQDGGDKGNILYVMTLMSARKELTGNVDLLYWDFLSGWVRDCRYNVTNLSRTNPRYLSNQSLLSHFQNDQNGSQHDFLYHISSR